MTTLLSTLGGTPRLLTAGFGAPDPTDLDAAVASGAFAGLKRAVREHGPTDTIAQLRVSGLRGRGGGGYPTAEKWHAAATADAPTRYVVANGYEADPSTFVARALMEERPYLVVEGVAIAAFAVGATESIIAVRAEYAEAVRRLEIAVAQAEEAGFLGADVLGSGRDVRVTVRAVRGAYMLGEETALLNALEGKRGQPEQRPPYPTERGLFGAPTVVNDVLTLAAVPWILSHAADAFAAIGDPAAPGTVLVQVAGAVEEPGIAEVPTGTPIREIIDLAGGVPAGHRLKAVLVGGPSGGLLPPRELDTPYTFTALRAVGAHMGSGSILVADERACVVDLAALLTRFCADEACGKAIPCRIGLRRLSEIGERFTSGRARPTDVALASDLSRDIVASALCDHERRATGPLTTVIRYFRPELDEHLLRSACPAGVCHPLAVTSAGPAT
ncbi:MAG: NADH-ubiquinone oxidoreductase-F iron-sulfur binding region domain-containing protein [Chloroflexota bacterium]